MSNPHRKARRNKRYVPRPVRTPMMRPLREQISLDMHIALARLYTVPSDDARTDLASTLNTVSVAINGDPRFQEEIAVLNGAAKALMAYDGSRSLMDEELHILANMASVVDTILGLIDMETLFAAERIAVEAVRTIRSRNAAQPTFGE